MLEKFSVKLYPEFNRLRRRFNGRILVNMVINLVLPKKKQAASLSAENNEYNCSKLSLKYGIGVSSVRQPVSQSVPQPVSEPLTQLVTHYNTLSLSHLSVRFQPVVTIIVVYPGLGFTDCLGGLSSSWLSSGEVTAEIS